jgi:hypothetical protein
MSESSSVATENILSAIRRIKDFAERPEIRRQTGANAIGEILDRIIAIEARSPNIALDDRHQMQADMQIVVDWIARVSKLYNIPIHFPANT